MRRVCRRDGVLDGLGPRDTRGLLWRRQLVVVAVDSRLWRRGRIRRFQVSFETVSIRAVAGQPGLRAFLARRAERLVGQTAASPRSTPGQWEQVRSQFRQSVEADACDREPPGVPPPLPPRALPHKTKATLRGRLPRCSAFVHGRGFEPLRLAAAEPKAFRGVPVSAEIRGTRVTARRDRTRAHESRPTEVNGGPETLIRGVSGKGTRKAAGASEHDLHHPRRAPADRNDPERRCP